MYDVCINSTMYKQYMYNVCINSNMYKQDNAYRFVWAWGVGRRCGCGCGLCAVAPHAPWCLLFVAKMYMICT